METKLLTELNYYGGKTGLILFFIFEYELGIT